MELPDTFRSETIRCNGIDLHVVHNGGPYEGAPLSDPRPPLLCLHGFPEYWRTWENLMPELTEHFFIVAPDQRGCGRSEAPPDVSAYAAHLLVADMLELATAMFGDRAFNLAGHDFGASIAYALAFTAPDRVSRLMIANGAHPVCLQEALIDDPAQVEASQYFHTVREPGAGAKAAADDFTSLFKSVENHSTLDWLDDRVRQNFREAWAGPERLDAMFNWYRASPIIVPTGDQTSADAPLYGASSNSFRVTMPHLLVWGLDDTALLPNARMRLPEFCDDLTVHTVDGADHWILHTHPAAVAKPMIAFLAA